MATKPWKGTINNNVPSGYKPNKTLNKAPDTSLRLEYIHGYRCHDTRNNLRYNTEGNVVYHTAAVGIVLDPKDHTKQKYYMEHTDDILCLAIHGNLVVTGEIGKKPVLSLWDSSVAGGANPTAIAVDVGTIMNGIAMVAFSHDGKKIAAIAMDKDHTVYIYDVEKLKSSRTNGKPTSSALIIKFKGPTEDIMSL
jgi:WD40 repeat protein